MAFEIGSLDFDAPTATIFFCTRVSEIGGHWAVVRQDIRGHLLAVVEPGADSIYRRTNRAERSSDETRKVCGSTIVVQEQADQRSRSRRLRPQQQRERRQFRYLRYLNLPSGRRCRNLRTSNLRTSTRVGEGALPSPNLGR